MMAYWVIVGFGQYEWVIELNDFQIETKITILEVNIVNIISSKHFHELMGKTGLKTIACDKWVSRGPTGLHVPTVQPEGKTVHPNKLSTVVFPLLSQHARPWHIASYLSRDKLQSKAILHIWVTFLWREFSEYKCRK